MTKRGRVKWLLAAAVVVLAAAGVAALWPASEPIVPEPRGFLDPPEEQLTALGRIRSVRLVLDEQYAPLRPTSSSAPVSTKPSLACEVAQALIGAAGLRLVEDPNAKADAVLTLTVRGTGSGAIEGDWLKYSKVAVAGMISLEARGVTWTLPLNTSGPDSGMVSPPTTDATLYGRALSGGNSPASLSHMLARASGRSRVAILLRAETVPEADFGFRSSIRGSTRDILRRMKGRAVEPLITHLRDRGTRTWVALARRLPSRVGMPLAAALQDDALRIQAFAADALGDISDPRAVGPLIEALADEELARHAAEALGGIGDGRAVGPLLAYLVRAEPGFSGRRAAAETLCRFRSPEMIEPLVRMLRGDDADLAAAAAAVLAAHTGVPLDSGLPPDHYDRLEWESGPEDADAGALGADFAARVRERLVAEVRAALAVPGDGRALARLFARLPLDRRLDWKGAGVREMGCPAVGPLTALLADPDPVLRAGATRGLGLVGDGRAFDDLAAGLADSHPTVQTWTVRALGDLGDGRAVEHLIEAVGSMDVEHSVAAAEGLASIGDPRGVEPLVRRWAEDLDACETDGVPSHFQESLARYGRPALGRMLDLLRNPWVWRGAQDVLARMGPIAAEPLGRLLAEDPETAERAVAPLAALDCPEALPFVERALAHRDASIRLGAVQGLEWCRATPRAVDLLVAALADKDDRVREAATWGLAAHRDKRAVEPLGRLLRSGSGPDAARAAAYGLGRIGGREATDALLDALRAVPDPACRKAAAEALGEQGDPQAVPALAAALGDADTNVCRAAAQALGQIGGEAAWRALKDALTHRPDLGDAGIFAESLAEVEAKALAE